MKNNSDDSTNYLVAIVDYATQNNLWSEADNYNLQKQLWNLMQKQTKIYTMGDSSSIPLEIAEELKKSIYFCINVYCNNSGNIINNVQLLKNTSLAEIFTDGQKEVLKLVNKGQQLLQLVNQTTLAIDNISYVDTINALPDFFQNYDRLLMAHEIPCDIDYQLFKPIADLQGIAYINTYLQSLLYENIFCSKFPTANIKALLQANCVDYQQDLINIFGFVFNNAIGLAMLGYETSSLNITKDNQAELLTLAQKSNKKQLRAHIDNALNKLLLDYALATPKYKQYYKYASFELLTRMEYLKQTGFDGLFSSHSNNKQQQFSETFIDGKSMDDELLRELIDNIQDCTLLSEKIVLIKECITSVRDLSEILNSCFFGKELSEVYKTFSKLELSAILKYATNKYGDDITDLSDKPFWLQELLSYTKKDSLSP